MAAGVCLTTALFGLSQGQAVAATASTVSTADPASSNDGGIQEIVVTAQRRSENLQRVAATIEVVTPAEIRNAGLSTPADMTKLTTGLNLSFGGPNAQIFIRGVGDFSYSAQTGPGVAFNVDGVYVGSAQGVNGNFYDIARLEVLKGPQGTLYGRNANGGSINLLTNAPELGKTYADLNVEGGNYSLSHESGAVNLPVGADAALRVAFNIVHRNGYLSDGTDDDVQQDGRVRFKWRPDSDVSLLLNADISHIGGKGAGFTYLPQRPGSNSWEAVSAPAANAYRATVLPLGPLVSDAKPDSSLDNLLYNFSGQLDWNLGFATLTVIPAYRHLKIDSLTVPGFSFGEKTKGDQESLESRLGNTSGGLTWVVGTYLYRFAEDDIGNVLESPILQDVTVTLNPRTTAYAGFGQVTWSVVDSLRVIGGIRYTYEHRTLSGLYINQSPLTGGPNQIIEDFGGTANFSAVTYKAGVEYDLATQNLLYFTVSTGYKAGGLGQTVAPQNVYQPEKLRSFELGSRNQFLDNHLQVNLSAYDWHYTDIQDSRSAFDPLGVVNFLVINDGNATIRGGTVDVVAQPTSADRFTLSAEYANSRYDSYNFSVPTFVFNPASTGCPYSGPFPSTPSSVIRENCTGFELARVPRWTGILGYDHVFTFPSQATLTVGGTAKFSSARWLGTDLIPAERAPAYTVADVNMTYAPADRRWSVTAWARNVADKAYYLGGQEQPFVGGLFQANIAPPRTFGISAGMRFGDQ
jgi:iron complex outermembrane recepter protein